MLFNGANCLDIPKAHVNVLRRGCLVTLDLRKRATVYKYRHDQNARTLYKFHTRPRITEPKDTPGKPTNWKITMTVEITRADNWLEKGHWKYATSDLISQDLHSHYTKEQAVDFFRRHYEPT